MERREKMSSGLNWEKREFKEERGSQVKMKLDLVIYVGEDCGADSAVLQADCLARDASPIWLKRRLFVAHLNLDPFTTQCGRFTGHGCTA